jgi:hypothetical protein
MSEKKQSGRGSPVLNQLEDYAKAALTVPEPVGEIPFNLKPGPRPSFEEMKAERQICAEYRREMELPGIKVVALEDKAILQEKYERLRPAFNMIVETLAKTVETETSEGVLKNLDVLMDAAMWIGAYVFVTDGAQEFFELYSKRKQAELARGDDQVKKFSELIELVDSVTEGRKIFDSIKSALKERPKIAERLGIPEEEAPSPGAIHRAIHEVLIRREYYLNLNADPKE